MLDKIKVLVCGGRAYTNQLMLYKVLDAIAATLSRPIHIIQGEANGADILAKQWAMDRGLTFDAYPAQWKKYGRNAGLIRNLQMLDEGQPDLVVAFPGGNGTAHMVKHATRANVRVIFAEQWINETSVWE